MTKTLSINDVPTQLVEILAHAKAGDEIIIEDNGEPMATISPIKKHKMNGKRVAGLGKERVLGLREGQAWTSDDFDDELPDQFWLGEDE